MANISFFLKSKIMNPFYFLLARAHARTTWFLFFASTSTKHTQLIDTKQVEQIIFLHFASTTSTKEDDAHRGTCGGKVEVKKPYLHTYKRLYFKDLTRNRGGRDTKSET